MGVYILHCFLIVLKCRKPLSIKVLNQHLDRYTAIYKYLQFFHYSVLIHKHYLTISTTILLTSLSLSSSRPLPETSYRYEQFYGFENTFTFNFLLLNATVELILDQTNYNFFYYLFNILFKVLASYKWSNLERMEVGTH